MNHHLAQKLQISLPPESSGTGVSISINGPLRNINSLADIINLMVKFLFPLAGILVFVYFVWGGLSFITSHGDPEKVTGGKTKMTSALVGFILLFLSYFLVGVVARILGLGDGII